MVKKLNLAQYIEILEAGKKYKAQHPSLREGQALWAVVYEKYPDLAVKSQMFGVDPFNDDSLIPAFCTYIYENGR